MSKQIITRNDREYARWLSTQTEDFVLDPFDSEDIFKQCRLPKPPGTRDQQQQQTIKHSNSYSKILTKAKIIKCKPDFNFVYTWTRVPKNEIYIMFKYFTVKDILALSSTCRYLNELCSDAKFWAMLISRDFSNIWTLNMNDSDEIYRLITKNNPSPPEMKDVVDSTVISEKTDKNDEVIRYTIRKKLKLNTNFAKFFYKYVQQVTKGFVIHHSGFFLKSALANVANLTKSLVDFVLLRNQTIRPLINTFKRTGDLLDNLNLSWILDEGLVHLWIAGFKTANNNQFKPTCNIICSLSVSKHEKYKNTFFMNDQYIVIETEKILRPFDSEQQQMTDVSMPNENPIEKIVRNFYIYSLEEELRQLIFAERAPPPFKVAFIKGDTFEEQVTEKAKFLSNVKDEFLITLDQSNIVIKNKTLSPNVLMFFTKSSNKTQIQVFNVKTRKQLDFGTIELESPVYDILPCKKDNQNHEKTNEESIFFAIDQESNLYYIFKSEKIGFKSNKVILDVGPETINCDLHKNQEDVSEKFDDLYKRYHHDLFFDNKNSDEGIEYLVIKKNSRLLFIDLESVDTNRIVQCNSKEISSNANWNVINDQLCIVDNENVHIYQFSLKSSTIEAIKTIAFENHQQPFGGYKSIYMDSCYFIILKSFTLNINSVGRLKIFAGPTQMLLSSSNNDEQWSISNLEIINLLNEYSNSEVQNQHKIDVTFQNGKMLIKTSRNNFLINVDTSYITKKQSNNAAKFDLEKVYLDQIEYSEEAKKDAITKNVVQKSKTVEYIENYTNNNSSSKKQKKNWKNSHKMDGDSADRREGRHMKGKGYKAFKNNRNKN